MVDLGPVSVWQLPVTQHSEAWQNLWQNRSTAFRHKMCDILSAYWSREGHVYDPAHDLRRGIRDALIATRRAV